MGGKQPVADGVIVDVKFHDGGIQEGRPADNWEWRKEDADPRITQYRVISQPQAEEVVMKGPFVAKAANQEATEIEVDDFINSGTWHEDQIDGPLRWRDCVNELDAYIEEFTREREALISRLALEGFALLPAMAPVMGVADYAPPLCDWMVGDIVEVISNICFCNGDVKIGDQYPITSRDSVDVKGPAGTYGDTDNYRFIRRP